MMMGRGLSSVVLTGVMLVAGTRVSGAQTRGGFWMDLGVGEGGLRLNCSSCSAVSKTSGHTITASIGGSTERNVLLGLEGQIWSGQHQSVSSLTVIAQWYPSEHAGLFFRGGTGIVEGQVSRDDASAQAQTVRGSGVALTLGVGYDFPISRRFALTVQIADHVDALGDLSLPGVTYDDTIAYVFRFSASLTLR